MRTIEQSIAVLEKWREGDKQSRRWELHSEGYWSFSGNRNIHHNLPSVSITFPTKPPSPLSKHWQAFTYDTIAEALDKAASAVEGE